jgi:hypothetical protein
MDLVFAKADGDIEAGLEMLGELGRSHVVSAFYSPTTVLRQIRGAVAMVSLSC